MWEPHASIRWRRACCWVALLLDESHSREGSLRRAVSSLDSSRKPILLPFDSHSSLILPSMWL